MGLVLAHSQRLPSLLLPLSLKSLKTHLATQCLQLQASVELYEFDHQSNLELTWVAEHMPRTSSTSCTQCWDSAQSLQHKHKVVPPFPPRTPDIPFPDLRSPLPLSVCPSL